MDPKSPGEPIPQPQMDPPLDSAEEAWDVGLAAAFNSAATGPYQPVPRLEPGTILAGKYQLMEHIGEGGMGSVWVAHQSEPVKRKVAVKLIKPGMDSRQVLARFEAERQALALMDHPNIAKVLDAGVTPDNRPFFVMELVKGVPITQYCDAQRLTPRQRLELFVPVCQAIQHAHHKGIIHRDVKPSNVLIALYDDRPVPKVIDFGVAKATGGTLTEATIDTGFGAIVGTPQYVSPEQATFNNLDVDTRSDVYALGVLLYELLTGSPPFARRELEKKGVLEILRIIREEEPPKPSTKLSTANALPALSANRGMEPKKLTGLLRNELDWIVMKALEKDRSRRYETANGFAADVQRYLHGEPVVAHPPSATYRMRKFVRRHRPQVVAAGLVTLALLGGIAGTTFGLVQARGAEAAERIAKQDAEMQSEKALQALENEAAQRKQAERAQAETSAVLHFVEGKILAAARPEGAYGGLGRDVTLRKAVDAAVPFVEKSFNDQPLIEARLRGTLGMSYYYLGRPEDSLAQWERAYAIHRAVHGRDDHRTLTSAENLANAYGEMGRFAEAIKLQEEILPHLRNRLGPDHRDTLSCLHNLANHYEGAGRSADALRLYEEVLPLRRAKLGAAHAETLQTMNNLANRYNDLGRHGEACQLREEVLRGRQELFGQDHPATLSAMSNLSNSYYFLRRYDEALQLREKTLALMRAKLGPDHPQTLRVVNNLSNSYEVLGRPDEARKLREETLTRRIATLGRDHPETLSSYKNLGADRYKQGRYAEALKLFEDADTLSKNKLGPGHSQTLDAVHKLAQTYLALNRHADATPLLDEVLVRGARSQGFDPQLLSSAVRYRLRCSRQTSDLAGCQRTTELVEQLPIPDVTKLVLAACCRSVAASLQAKLPSPDNGVLAQVEADKGMASLRKAVAAGFGDVTQLQQDPDLEFLRQREDYKQLVAEAEAKQAGQEKQ